MLLLVIPKSLASELVPTSPSTESARIVPIFKKGNRGSVENYRPISLTSVTSKILEHIVHSSIMDHLDKHSSLNTFQHGFRQKRSCETQLADCLNGKGQIDAVLLDFSKAFDKVDNEKLLTKLHSLGIGDLHVLQAYEPENKLELHPDKCQVLRITNNKKSTQETFNIHNTRLSIVQSAKYFGVLINSTGIHSAVRFVKRLTQLWRFCN